MYAVSVMGTTGERDQLTPSAAALAARVKKVTDLPVLLGFGITTPEQAADVIRKGIAPMPAFGSMLSDAQISDLIAYLKVQ